MENLLTNPVLFTSDKWLSGTIFLFEVLYRILPMYKIQEYIKNKLFYTNDFNIMQIPSYHVPVMKMYSTIPIMKTIYSPRFLAVVHYVLKYKKSEISSFMEILTANTELNKVDFTKNDPSIQSQVSLSESQRKQAKSSYSFTLVPSCNYEFEIAPGIFFELQDVSQRNGPAEEEEIKKEPKSHSFVIVLTEKKKGNSQIEPFVVRCEEEYNLFCEQEDSDYFNLIYEYEETETVDSSTQLKFNAYQVEHNKTMKSIFLEKKEDLCNYISQFKWTNSKMINEHEARCLRLGYTYKGGMLFYGKPGCGKTAAIKAILNETGRTGIVVNLSKISTCKELQDIFRKRTFNNRILSGKQLLYILEDCDASDNNVLLSRSLAKTDPCSNGEVFKMKKDKEEPSAQKTPDRLNLSCILNTLDGVIQLDGVLFIITTNYPEKMDPAIFRPGRIDYMCEFKYATSRIIKELLSHHYEVPMDQVESYVGNIILPEYTFSPALVQSICIKSLTLHDCIHNLLNVEKESVCT